MEIIKHVFWFYMYSCIQTSEASREASQSWAPEQWEEEEEGLVVEDQEEEEVQGQSIKQPLTAWWWREWAPTSTPWRSNTHASNDGSSNRLCNSTSAQVSEKWVTAFTQQVYQDDECLWAFVLLKDTHIKKKKRFIMFIIYFFRMFLHFFSSVHKSFVCFCCRDTPEHFLKGTYYTFPIVCYNCACLYQTWPKFQVMMSASTSNTCEMLAQASVKQF